jgi:hypothetical protein
MITESTRPQSETRSSKTLPRSTETLRSNHRQVLIICSLVIAAAPLLQVLPNERVALRGMDNLVLPPSCPSRELFGVSCPGCGLTRSFVHLAHGDWSSSWRVHRIGWLLMLVFLLQIPYRAYLLWGPGKYRLRQAASDWIGIGLIALLLGNWLAGQLAGLPG